MGIVAHLFDSSGLNVTSGHNREAERMGLETLLLLWWLSPFCGGEGSQGGEMRENPLSHQPLQIMS